MDDAKSLTDKLGGKWYGLYGSAPCPVCQPDRNKGQNALTLSDGAIGLLAHCKKSACQFRDILNVMGLSLGTFTRPDPKLISVHNFKRKAEEKRKSQQALAIWKETKPISGTIAEQYLRGRGITCELAKALRFHPTAWHGATAKRIPALIAKINVGETFAIHRTYLQTDGSGKANVDPPKAMLGAAAGGAVGLTQGIGPLVVAEGIETALSLASGLLSGPASIWAALSTSGMRGLHLPPMPARLTIAPDGDKPGREAANALAERAHTLGWQVSLLLAPDGRDWNDVLNMKGDAA